MQIKKIEKSELEQLLFISQQQFASESWSKSQYLDAFCDKNYIFFGVFINNTLASFVVANESIDDVNILMLATKENCKRKKYAQSLIEYLQNYVKLQNKTLSLEVKEKNLPAINLYKKLQFCVISVRKNYYKDGQNAMIMFFNVTNN